VETEETSLSHPFSGLLYFESPAPDHKGRACGEFRGIQIGHISPISLIGRMRMKNFIPPHGGYEKLLSFQKARIVYDGTVWFCKHFLEKRDRTYDQMVQAARSGK